VIVHMPMSFIHDLVGLLGGGGGASFLVDVFVQYLSRNEPETHLCRDFSSEAASTPLTLCVSALDLILDMMNGPYLAPMD